MAFTNSIISSPGASLRNIDRIFEDAQLKGILKLNSRKLKEFPKVASKYDLSDVVSADLSKNRLSELPEELCSFTLLESLNCYNNVIRSVPDIVINLQSLTCLDLSRNQLTVIPISLCHLPLQVLNLRNNRLVSIPEEIASMKCLRDLDVSCNEITIVPPQLGSVSTLQRLNLKRNLLLEMPLELCGLQGLVHLDVSANRISSIPTQFRLMSSLQQLLLHHNPITFPPAVLCERGRIHIFKFLEIQAIKEDKRGIVLETEFQKFRSPSILSDSRFPNGFTAGSCRKSYTFDSGYSTSDGDCRSQESQDLTCFRKHSAESPRWETAAALKNTSSCANGELFVEECISTVQTFKEYKEALKKKRESSNVYKKNNITEENNGGDLSPKLSAPKTSAVSKQSSESPLLENGGSRGVEDSSHHLPKINPNTLKKCGERKLLLPEDRSSSLSAANFSWPKNSPSKPLKSSFTMKRELDKAREEQELISNLRQILESRLKLQLPEELECALNDGVFLCHLANHIRANSVTCIHVPSPAVPKLTVAKCRRNADNFLEACRRLGVPNAELQHWADSYPRVTQENRQPVALSCLLLVLLFGTFLLLYAFPCQE